MKSECIGKWRISEMEQWDQDFIDLVVPGYINFEKGGDGSKDYIKDALAGGKKEDDAFGSDDNVSLASEAGVDDEGALRKSVILFLSI